VNEIPVVVPELAAPAERIRVCAWYVQPGDHVSVDEPVVALAIAGATCDVSAPCPGRISRVVAPLNTVVEAGAVCAWIDPAG